MKPFRFHVRVNTKATDQTISMNSTANLTSAEVSQHRQNTNKEKFRSRNATDHVAQVNHETQVDQPTTEDHVILVNLATEHVTLAHNEISVEHATADHETRVGHETDHIQPENQVDIETI